MIPGACYRVLHHRKCVMEAVGGGKRCYINVASGEGICCQGLIVVNRTRPDRIKSIISTVIPQWFIQHFFIMSHIT